jgi:two-component system, LytTR family, sensor kinase
VSSSIAFAVVVLCVTTLLGVLVWVFRRSPSFGTAGQAATYEVLHAANLASPVLRGGFNADTLQRAAPQIRALLDTPSVAITDLTHMLGFAGESDHHIADAVRVSAETIDKGGSHITGLSCGREGCAVRFAVSVPVSVRGDVIGALIAFDAEGQPGLIRSMTEVALWIASQTELAEFDDHRARLARAELKALRAQISPHFIYNALSAIASFTRSDPERARNLILEFADFTRYSLSSHGEFSTVAEELRCVERYLALEKARFGDRLDVSLRVSPEILPVAIPFLVIQPLVENAIRHGLEGQREGGRLSIVAFEQSNECVITVEDDGVGANPEQLLGYLNGDGDRGEHIGLHNVDERLRSTFGASYGLVIETALGAGTKVTVRAPKYRPGVRA